jgi:hypothetical protein
MYIWKMYWQILYCSVSDEFTFIKYKKCEKKKKKIAINKVFSRVCNTHCASATCFACAIHIMQVLLVLHVQYTLCKCYLFCMCNTHCASATCFACAIHIVQVLLGLHVQYTLCKCYLFCIYNYFSIPSHVSASRTSVVIAKYTVVIP